MQSTIPGVHNREGTLDYTNYVHEQVTTELLKRLAVLLECIDEVIGIGIYCIARNVDGGKPIGEFGESILIRQTFITFQYFTVHRTFSRD